MTLEMYTIPFASSMAAHPRQPPLCASSELSGAIGDYKEQVAPSGTHVHLGGRRVATRRRASPLEATRHLEHAETASGDASLDVTLA